MEVLSAPVRLRAGEARSLAEAADSWWRRWLGGAEHAWELTKEYCRAGRLYGQVAAWLRAAECLRRAHELSPYNGRLAFYAAEAYALSLAEGARDGSGEALDFIRRHYVERVSIPKEIVELVKILPEADVWVLEHTPAALR